MKPLLAGIKLPIIISSKDASQELLSIDYLFRIQDCIAILNRIATKWDCFHLKLERGAVISTQIETEIRLETIETTYSFITFVFLLLSFYKGALRLITEATSQLNFDTSPLILYPQETPAVARLRTIRNKMVAHTADIEPHNDDSKPNRLAYLQWYVGHWGIDHDSRNRRLNTFGMTTGHETSTHIIPPTLEEMFMEVQSFISLCDQCVLENGRYLAGQVKNQKSYDFLFVGFFPE